MFDSRAIAQGLFALDFTPIVVAIVVGGLIGFERESHGRPAGFRTHILVCLASALLVSGARHLPSELARQSDLVRVVMDPNRLGAGIMTGIGFLGAASVVRAGDIVRGITTGATVWSVAGLGVVIGQGEYALALVGGGVVLIVLSGFDRVSRRVAPVIYRRLVVRGAGSPMPAMCRSVARVLEERGVRVQDLSGTRGREGEPFELVFHIRCQHAMQAPELLEQVSAQNGVLTAEWSLISH
jgi:putative Mg2+ transporter-C (MgtC) family protein